MSKAIDLAEAQQALDRDRENVEEAIRTLHDYCVTLRNRIGRLYGCMATAGKHREMMAQRAKMAETMDYCDDLLSYLQDEGAQTSIDYAPRSERELAEERLAQMDAAVERTESPDIVGAMQEVNDLLQGENR